jgi:hypothetical protein
MISASVTPRRFLTVFNTVFLLLGTPRAFGTFWHFWDFLMVFDPYTVVFLRVGPKGYLPGNTTTPKMGAVVFPWFM